MQSRICHLLVLYQNSYQKIIRILDLHSSGRILNPVKFVDYITDYHMFLGPKAKNSHVLLFDREKLVFYSLFNHNLNPIYSRLLCSLSYRLLNLISHIWTSMERIRRNRTHTRKHYILDCNSHFVKTPDCTQENTNFNSLHFFPTNMTCSPYHNFHHLAYNHNSQ
mmetsp:Transcript_25581/g.4281  ORF Transcript_25581/g.4281 Transcript_25581/m.4281 type:complete len:165 (-) Transcript_25581:494-988(-)